MEWKEIKGYRETYLISDTGSVCRLRKKDVQLPYHENNSGYFRVALNIDGKSRRYFVHRLVAETFLPRIEGKKYVNHKNGNKHDNNVSNLEWCTFQENIQHAWSTGAYSKEKRRKTSKKGEMHPMHKLSQKDVDWIRAHHIPFDNTYGSKAMAVKFGVRPQTITDIANNRSWKDAVNS